MNRPVRLLFLSLILTLCAATSRAQPQEVRAFFFGNSLIYHLEDGEETAVPHWLALLARAGGHDFAADGTFGFLPDYARDLPPVPGWDLSQVTRVWSGEGVGFRRAGFDTVILSPMNFLQHQAPDAPYDWAGMEGANALDLTARVFDWTRNNAAEADLWIYEGWADMGDWAFPPSATGLTLWHDWNTGDYHQWHLDLVEAINARLPRAQVRLIPVASVLSQVLAEAPLEAIPVTDLYTDDAPHGTPTIYLLAAMVTHAALFQEVPPALPLPDSIAPALRDNYAAVAARIAQLTTGAALPLRAEAPPEGANPALGVGLAGISDWGTQHPFLNLFKSARPWTAHRDGEWGAYDIARLTELGHVSPEGWLVSLPPDATSAEAFLLTDQPEGAESLAGDYILSWRGRGEVDLGGRARVTGRADREIRFSYTPGEGLVSVILRALDPADPVRDITVVRADRQEALAAGAVFAPEFLARLQDLRLLRFMDWMATNGSPQVTWEDRPRPSDATYALRGVPVEVMVQLANQVGADPWFTLPHQADDDYARRFAAYVHDHLAPGLVAHAEWSNEVWNWIFPQAQWAAEQARARWGEGAPDDAWMQFAGLRAAEVAAIWAEVFADAPGRLSRVIAVHTGWPGLEEPLLRVPLNPGQPAPGESFDAYAVTGYIGHGAGSDEAALALRDWIAAGTATENLTARLREGSLAELTGTLWPHHARVAAEAGLSLIMYEGGTHVVGEGAVTEDEGITAFFTSYNYSPEMAAIYADLLTGWDAVGGTVFNAFVDVAPPSRWGSWGALRHPDDANPRWATLAAWNETAPRWDSRPPGAFAGGIWAEAGPEGGEIAGTPHPDVLIGAAGDDLFVPGGGDDIIAGGEGRDTVRLAGRAVDHSIALSEGRVTISGALGTLRLLSVELALFTEDEGALVTLPQPVN